MCPRRTLLTELGVCMMPDDACWPNSAVLTFAVISFACQIVYQSATASALICKRIKFDFKLGMRVYYSHNTNTCITHKSWKTELGKLGKHKI